MQKLHILNQQKAQNMATDKAMQLAQKLFRVADESKWPSMIDTHTAQAVQEATAEHRRVLDSVMDNLCAIKDLSNLDHMARARSLALGAMTQSPS